MSLSPAALEAYSRDYLRDRQRQTAQAALVALARQAAGPRRSPRLPLVAALGRRRPRRT